MSDCAFCGKPVNTDNPDHYKEAVSWVTGPKLDHPVMREQTGRIAHHDCVQRQLRGQAVDQPELFGEDAQPLLTDEPGKVTKLTGPNSVSSPGPDEDPEWMDEPC